MDGGLSWEYLFFVNEYMGVVDLSMDLINFCILYVGMWDYECKFWQIRSGGEGFGLFCFMDGGENWQKFYDGFFVVMGKVGVVVFLVNLQIIYVNIEVEKGGVY